MGRGLIAFGMLVSGATAAHAEDRLDLFATSDAQLLEPAFHLDRGEPYESRTASGLDASAGLGVGSERHHVGAVGDGTLAAGRRSRHVLALLRSELAGDDRGILRGHHRGLLEYRADEDADIAGALTLRGDLEHGEARGLAPVQLGPGRRDTGDAAIESQLRIGRESDFTAAGVLGAEVGATRWDAASAPTIDHAERRALTIGLAAMPQDGELPRGHIDILRGRVEQISLHGRPMLVDPAARSIAGAVDGEARIVEVGAGATEMTFHVDHEMLAVIDGDLGWSWIEVDSGARHLADNAMRIRIATALKWKNEHGPLVRRLGIAFARLPSVTADGSRIVGDWRVELGYGAETKRVRLAARGGISWLAPFAGDVTPTPVQLLVRYGAQLEADAKLGTSGLEIGVYHANHFEPVLAGDPWASSRRWATETGLVARVRR